jgi:hypothetical protein
VTSSGTASPYAYREEQAMAGPIAFLRRIDLGALLLAVAALHGVVDSNAVRFCLAPPRRPFRRVARCGR